MVIARSFVGHNPIQPEGIQGRDGVRRRRARAVPSPTEAPTLERGDDRGSIFSFTVSHRAFHPGFSDEIVPYVIAIVALEVRMGRGGSSSASITKLRAPLP